MQRIISLILFLLLAPGLPFAGSGRAGTGAQESLKKPGAKPSKSRGQESLSEAGAISTSPLALPFKRSWQYLTESASSILPTLDESRIYLALAGGRAVCLDRETGSLLWTSEPGGVISAPIAVGETSVYIVTRKIADDGSEAGASLRAVDKGTGLTLWVRDYERRFTSSLALAKDRIYVGSADGSLYALSASSGEPVWKFATQDAVRGRALLTERAIYFGSDDGALYSVEPADAKLLWRVQTGGKIIGKPALDSSALYFGSGDGYAYSVDAPTGKLRWRSRTGAAIEASPVVVEDRVLVASFDNFIYALAKVDGDRIWKRRMENRIAADPLVFGDATMIAPLRGEYVAVFLNSDGRRVNLYRLEKGFEIVADPIFSGNLLLLSTDKGLVVATTSQAKADNSSVVKNR